MFVRVQHIDGTLEPAVSVDVAERFGLPVGTTFALADGRWVQVIGHTHEGDPTLQYAIVGEVPERRSYSATGHEAYVRDASEMRMGSPQYGTLVIDGSPLDVDGHVEERSLIWSNDGRYLGACVLDSWSMHPVTRAIVIDAEARTVIATSEPRCGYASPLQFIGRSLSYYQAHDPEGDAYTYLPF